MGGILIIAATVVSVLMWAKLTIPLVWIFVGAFTAFGALGFLDDYLKVVKKDRDGLSSRQKLLGQIVISTVSIYALDHLVETGHFLRQFYVPFWKHPVWQMSLIVTLVWGCLVLISSSNAVNLSDGMDGLATGCMVICALTFAVFAYFCGHSRFADYLNIPFIAGSGEVAIFATAIAGATLGFLWTNCYPAAVFMGDTGSLALGGAIGLIALLVRQELLLVVVGGIFVLEAGSAFLQIGFFKLTRRLTGTPRRLFKCAPIHHHLKQSGWTETQIVIRFWIISAVLAAAGLATLKIR
ncbi:MAG: phospho-N-acetylmuramoyl-pentapeptide-transferase, partial [Lentisphaerae bacterium]